MGRAPCCDKANVKKGPWSPEEDAKLKSYIEKHGTGGNWIALPQKIGLKRCGKSCRLRWLNYLRPNIKHGGFTEAEDNLICSLYVNIGSRWSIIAAQLPGRTDNDIKNYWNTRLKKKLFGKHRRELQAAARRDQMIINCTTKKLEYSFPDHFQTYPTGDSFSLYPRPPQLAPPPPPPLISSVYNNTPNPLIADDTSTQYDGEDFPYMTSLSSSEVYQDQQQSCKNSMINGFINSSCPADNYDLQAFDEELNMYSNYMQQELLVDGFKVDNLNSAVEMVNCSTVTTASPEISTSWGGDICSRPKMDQDSWVFLDEPRLLDYSQ